MNKKMKQAIWEATKEPLRLLAIALIPVLLVYFEGLSVEWAAIIVVVLRWADKLLYKVGELKKDPALSGGLVRF